MDTLVPFTMRELVFNIVLVLAFFTVMVIVFPLIALALAPMLVLFYLTAAYFRRTSRQVKRIEGTTRSPLFAHISQTLTG